MNSNERIAALKTQLRIATGLHDLYMHPNFQEHFLPYLKQLSTIEHIDPKRFNNKEEYQFALENANMEARVYSNLIKFMSSQEHKMSQLLQEIKKPVTSYET